MSDGQDVVLRVEDESVSFVVHGGRGGGGPPPARAVTRGVSFELRRGRVLALVGESGSGKSVTAMSVLGLLPDGARVTGSVRLFGPGDDGARTRRGRELLGAAPAQLREVRGGIVGAVFQEPMTSLNPGFTVGNQVAEAVRGHGPRRGGGEVRRRVLELLGSVGLDEPERIARSHPHQLSGGQLQRAMIAMALAAEPAVLIADEPTTALDVTVQAGILDLLHDLVEHRDLAVLLITHDMGVVADIADDVVVMRNGRVVERAPVGQLFAAPATEYTRELLAAVPSLHRGPAAAWAEGTPDPGEVAARLDHLEVVYPGRGAPAVADVSLTLAAGRTLGLVGESGSGKSTVAQALAGLVAPRAGLVELAGVDLARASRHELARARGTLGFVFQDPASSLNPRHTVGWSIAEPLRLHGRTDAKAVRARVAELLEAVRLDPAWAGRHPHELSGGQRQRVAIARALVLDPALVIADEPTSALDVSVQAGVLELLVRLQRARGFACLFISHDLAVVRQVAHDVAVMRRGRIVERGPVDRVLDAPGHEYTRRLLASVPVPDPVVERSRRETRARAVPA